MIKYAKVHKYTHTDPWHACIECSGLCYAVDKQQTHVCISNMAVSFLPACHLAIEILYAFDSRYTHEHATHIHT